MHGVVDEADVVVIGGGITGCATAYHLARAGKAVVLLEQAVIGYMESGRNAGGVRQQGRDLRELPMALESIRLWQTLDEELECETEYRRGGNLILAMNDAEAENLASAITQQQAFGLSVSLLTGREARQVCPVLSDAVVAASYCPTDGQANPMATTIGFARAAARSSATLRLHTEVLGIEVVDGAVRGVITPAGTIRTAVVVNAAGPWARKVGELAGCHVPVLNRRVQMMVTERLPPLFSEFISGNTISFNQTRSGGVVIGGSGPWECLGYDTMPTARSLLRFACRTGHLAPILETATAVRSWAGVSGRTKDEIPIMGFVEHPTGFCNACGFSGHGFALGPASGKCIADLIVTGKSTVPLDAFALSRFEPEFDPVAWYESVRVEEPPISGMGGMILLAGSKAEGESRVKSRGTLSFQRTLGTK